MPPIKGKRQKEKASIKGKLGVKKRQENMKQRAVQSKCIGTIVFSGLLFGDKRYTLRCLSHHYENHFLVEINGALYQPRTFRGLKTIIANKIWYNWRKAA